MRTDLPADSPVCPTDATARKHVLVTGGAGYIGTHTLVELQSRGHEAIVLDDFSNGHPGALARVADITGQPPVVVQGDVRDTALLRRLFAHYPVDAVIHFAGLKAVGESVRDPLAYYDTNVAGTLALCRAMEAAGVRHLVFSSSATVYGETAPVPYTETQPRGEPQSPYAASKAMVERMLEDLCRADPRWCITLLRYFNPIGAHPSGLLGEAPQGTPNNLMPYLSQVAAGQRDRLSIFGHDYPTPDGTCVRDYLHVVDLALGHLAALEQKQSPGCACYNLGTGQGRSVLEMVHTFQRVNNIKVPYVYAPRRCGDLPAFWANADKARHELGWQAQRGLEQMLTDTWRWQTRNPHGYTPHGYPPHGYPKTDERSVQ